jgi:hypothetical protein
VTGNLIRFEAGHWQNVPSRESRWTPGMDKPTAKPHHAQLSAETFLALQKELQAASARIVQLQWQLSLEQAANSRLGVDTANFFTPFSALDNELDIGGGGATVLQHETTVAQKLGQSSSEKLPKESNVPFRASSMANKQSEQGKQGECKPSKQPAHALDPMPWIGTESHRDTSLDTLRVLQPLEANSFNLLDQELPADSETQMGLVPRKGKAIETENDEDKYLDLGLAHEVALSVGLL